MRGDSKEEHDVQETGVESLYEEAKGTGRSPARTGGVLTEHAEDYLNRCHIKEEYDVPHYALEALADESRTDEEVDMRSVNRRQFLGLSLGMAYSSGLTYTLDSAYNTFLLQDNKADNYEAPADTYHERAVKEMLDGNEIRIQIYNVRFDNQESQYDEQKLVDYVERSISELEGTNFGVEFQNLNATEQGVLGDRQEFEQFDQETQQEISDKVEQYEDIIKNNTVAGSIDQHNSLWPDNNTNLTSQVDVMLLDLTEPQPHEFEDIKVVIAPFADGAFAGASTYDHKGKKDWALVNRADQQNTEEIVVHELGHKLGLTHTKYPDWRRGGFFPDVMSYSPATKNMLNTVHSIVDGSAFGKQSHYNWREVKQHVRSKTQIQEA